MENFEGSSDESIPDQHPKHDNSKQLASIHYDEPGEIPEQKPDHDNSNRLNSVNYDDKGKGDFNEYKVDEEETTRHGS